MQEGLHKYPMDEEMEEGSIEKAAGLAQSLGRGPQDAATRGGLASPAPEPSRSLGFSSLPSEWEMSHT